MQKYSKDEKKILLKAIDVYLDSVLCDKAIDNFLQKAITYYNWQVNKLCDKLKNK
jgi:hypothetical protein